MEISRSYISSAINSFFWKKISIAPLITFRVLFGLMMVVSILRFVSKGWIEELYIQPDFFFTYYGFDWVQPLGETGMYLLYATMLLSAFGILLGCFYRWSSIAFFLLFTYVELIDKTYYLNHYYFVSIISFLLIFVPAHRHFSIDALRRPLSAVAFVPAWSINIFKLQLGLVYFFAGVAKLHPAWLFDAMPLKLWLPSVSETPLIGFLFNYEWTAYLFSWTGAVYDLCIVFFLLFASTRLWAYLAVVVFHLMTAALFQIGMFPYIMMGLTLIYFSANFHELILTFLKKILSYPQGWGKVVYESTHRVETVVLLSLFFVIQLFLPFRFLTYPGSVYWTEQGYRFSWRVMLMEKGGHTTFTVSDRESKRKEWINNYDYLTPQQEKMMSTQPDMILQFAHFLAKVYRGKGFEKPIIRCNSKVTLNGQRSRSFIDPTVDLAQEKRGFHHKSWILPLNEKQ